MSVDSVADFVGQKMPGEFGLRTGDVTNGFDTARFEAVEFERLAPAE